MKLSKPGKAWIWEMSLSRRLGGKVSLSHHKLAEQLHPLAAIDFAVIRLGTWRTRFYQYLEIPMQISLLKVGWLYQGYQWKYGSHAMQTSSLVPASLWPASLWPAEAGLYEFDMTRMPMEISTVKGETERRNGEVIEGANVVDEVNDVLKFEWRDPFGFQLHHPPSVTKRSMLKCCTVYDARPDVKSRAASEMPDAAVVLAGCPSLFAMAEGNHYDYLFKVITPSIFV
jgi:hypothetical protein